MRASMSDDPRPSFYSKPRLVGDTTPSKPLLLKPARLPDPKKIDPRRWLLGTQALRGFVTVLVAPGGTGKSIYAMTAALSLCTGKRLLDLHVWERVNAAVVNEDPMDELERRVAAIMIRHKIDETDVSGYFFLNSMDDDPVIMATRDPDGFSVIHPAEKELVEQIRENSIGFLVVDPFAESHTLEENSNPDMIKAAAAWRRVARQTSCAIMLVHHVRKGVNEGGIDAARGAKALTDSARVGLLMQTMTEEEAKAVNVEPEQRFGYVRVDDAKVNLSPRIDKARWYRMSQVELGNGDDIYPNGDKVAALVPWEPPALFAQISVEQVNQALDAIATGLEPGVLFGATRRNNSERWAGDAVRRVCDVSEKQAQMMLDEWLKTGLLFQQNFKHPHRRKDMLGLHVDNSKRPT